MVDSTAVLVPVYLRPNFSSGIIAGFSVGIPQPASMPGSRVCESDTKEEHRFETTPSYPRG